jgi:hypothetical protein
MFKKIILIIIMLVGYTYLVSTDPKKTLCKKSKAICYHYYKSFKKMDLQIKVNKFPF